VGVKPEKGEILRGYRVSTTKNDPHCIYFAFDVRDPDKIHFLEVGRDKNINYLFEKINYVHVNPQEFFTLLKDLLGPGEERRIGAIKNQLLLKFRVLLE